MKALRIAILSLFVVSVAVTAWSMLSHHNHMLHIAHVALISLTFLIIAVYLYKSAEIASLAANREMRFRLTVDPEAKFIEYAPSGSHVLNACVGAAAKMRIYARSARSMASLAKQKTIAIDGNSESREGYEMTSAALMSMGVKMVSNADACPIKMKLGPFDAELDEAFDFVLIGDKIAHVLAAVFISRVYLRFTLYARILLILALAFAGAFLVLEQFTYAAASLAILAAARIMLIRQIERMTTRMTFKSVTKYAPRSVRG